MLARLFYDAEYTWSTLSYFLAAAIKGSKALQHLHRCHT